MQDHLELVAKALKVSGELDNYVGKSDPVEHELAYDLCDIIGSLKKILEHWREIAAPSSPERVGEALFEIREELRHILYHAENSVYFSVICGPRD